MARNDYTLAVFDAKGQEVKDQHGDLGTQKAAAKLQNEAITDVFVMSHGWMGDLPSAIWQYDHWTDALMGCPDDLKKLAALRPGFKPLLVGFHWPSLPWGDEKAVESFGLDPTAPAFDPVADYTEKLGGTPEIEAAVKRIYAAIAASPDPNTMTPELKQAYQDLDKVVNPPAEGAGAEPGADRMPFDPQRMLEAVRDAEDSAASFGGFSLSGLLGPLREVSFWSMKGRARTLGESAGSNMLASLQKIAGGRDVRFHLMGHSFGCIVVSSMMKNADPVHSVVLVQGALSLWSYAPSIPKSPKTAGYFNTVLQGRKVLGPIVTTQSQFDKAVGTYYPIAAGLARQSDFAAIEFPLFGGVGTFGLQGLDKATALPAMPGVADQYNFQAGQILNIQSDNVIKAMEGDSGAHSDINHPEVGHVIWQASMTPV